ncbi:hypothetical protein [Vulcanisaeta sp. JCM 16159]|uniref:hypothetical protein n=1 Tax=Vulcanisaeta sp. JCM 16159 TaxID=1295371 RepID=UPI001FB1DE22|nr:hypothetical protein [Vulcanisaeta sp. JCM 16159]
MDRHLFVKAGDNGLISIGDVWLRDYGDSIRPSLIAFITYGVGDIVRTAVIAIPYNPAWVVTERPVEINLYVNFNDVKSLTVNTVNTNKDIYVWVLKQYRIFSGGVPLIFVGWGINAVKNLFLASISVGSYISNSGIYNILNENGSLISIGPTYFIQGTYYVLSPSSGIIISNTMFSKTENEPPIVQYFVPHQGFVYYGIPSYMANVSFQLYRVNSFGISQVNAWINGTMALAPALLDISYSTIRLNTYLDIGNGSLTRMFSEILRNKGHLIIINSLGKGLTNNCSQAIPPAIDLTSIRYYFPWWVMYTSMPNHVINLDSTILSLVIGVYVLNAFDNNQYITNAINNDAATMISYGYNNLGALIIVPRNTNFYITIIGNPLPITGPQPILIYPIGIIINESNYYLGGECQMAHHILLPILNMPQ